MQIYNLEFTQQEIRQAASAGRLLSMEIEFSRVCNFRCAYCYVDGEEERAGELTREEIKDIILQAKELGARKIIILGGEPSIYPHIVEMVQFIGAEGLAIEIFTNGSGIDRELAEVLAEEGARVVVKCNSLNEELQDRLAGRKGAKRIIDKAMAELRAVGYPSPERFLAVSTVICRQNIGELPAIWQWLREENIEPYFEVITPQANAVSNSWLQVAPDELYRLFTELARIDRERFQRLWKPQPPLVGNRCMRHQVSCVVTATGEVMPCVGVTIALGSIRRDRLAHILAGSEVIANLKNYRTTIKGACGQCEMAEECYGCRGAAYQLTGDYLASDPTCWRNALAPCTMPRE